MRTYTVKEIASEFGIDGETVRRWIRSGKLKATQSSKKEGYIVTEESLANFCFSNPKYIGDLDMPEMKKIYCQNLTYVLNDLKAQRQMLDIRIKALERTLKEEL